MEANTYNFRSYDQIRALHALEATRSQNKDYLGPNGSENIAKKVPVLIIECGLLGALAFALEKGVGYKAVFEAVRTHLASADIADPTAMGTKDAYEWFEKLAKAPASALRLATGETMAYLTYLRRFANPKGKRESPVTP